MILLIWALVLIISLVLLVRSSDWLTSSLSRASSGLKISPLGVGLVVLALGTSLPEISASFAAVLKGRSEIAAAAVVGSTLVNILLVVGMSAIVAKTLKIREKLVDLDASLFVINLGIFIFIVQDRVVNVLEGLFLLAAFFVYFLYVFKQNKKNELTAQDLITPELLDNLKPDKIIEILPFRLEKKMGKNVADDDFTLKDFFKFQLGAVGLAFGAYWAVEALIKMADILNIPATLAAMTVFSFGLALPELMISMELASRKKYELAMGNVFGACIFNLLLVVGLCSLAGPVVFDVLTYSIALPFLVASVAMIIISSLSRQIHIWEGMMYCLVYVLFLAKIFNFF